MNKDHHQVWRNCLTFIRDNLPERSFNTWFQPIVPKKLKDNVLTIQVPTYFYYEYLEEHYVDLLKASLRKELGEAAKLNYDVVVEKGAPTNGQSHAAKTMNLPGKTTTTHNDQSTQASTPAASTNGKHHTIRNPFVIPGVKKVDVDSQLNPNYTFYNFVEGDCNQLARSAGYAVAENPGGTAFNPLMLYGSAGYGKTHLAQAIGLHAQDKYPNKTVLYVTADKFITQYVRASHYKNIPDFVHFYQLVDMLIIDDIQDLGGKEKTQNTFFHIFNHLHQLGKQLILTSDKPPAELDNLEKRLLSRFKWGLTTEIKLPDYETRRNIILKKMHINGSEIPEDVIDYLAKNITTTVREIEGAIISLIAQSTMTRRPLNVELAKEILSKIIRQPNRPITIERILDTVCEFYNLEEEAIHSKSRKRDIVQARQVAMFLSKTYTKASLSTIGSKIGRKDHATVLHAYKTVTNLMDTDKKFKGQVEEIQKQIQHF